MLIAYGTFTSGSNEMAVSIASEELRTQSEVLYGFRQRWTLTAFPGVQGATQAAVTTAINKLVTAFNSDGGDLILYLDDGVTVAQSLLNANTMGGTHVRPVSFPSGTGAEYSTYRSYSVEVWGDVPLTGNNLLLEYEEQLEFDGNGGPIHVFIPVAQGPWVWQQTTTTSIYRVTQTGHAKGLTAYPAFNDPLWPGNLVSQQVRTSRGSPRLRRDKYLEFPITWSYPFEANLPLIGTPLLYPIQSP